MPLVKTLIFTIVVPGTALVLIPYFLLNLKFNFIELNFNYFKYFGIVLIILGILGYLSCAFNFAIIGKGTPAPIDPPKKLVIKGLYKYSRNPMYVSVLFVLLGEFIYFESEIIFIYLCILFLFFNLFVVYYEEPTLRKLFGIEYKNYCKKVPRWLFRLKINN